MNKKLINDEEMEKVTGGVLDFQPVPIENGDYYSCKNCFGCGKFVNADYEGEIPPKCPNCNALMEKSDPRIL